MIRLNEEESKKLINDVLEERKKRNIPKWIRENPQKYYDISSCAIFLLVMGLVLSIMVNAIAFNPTTQQSQYNLNIIGKTTSGNIALHHMTCLELKHYLIDLEINKPDVYDVSISDIQIMIQGKC